MWFLVVTVARSKRTVAVSDPPSLLSRRTLLHGKVRKGVPLYPHHSEI